MRPRSRCSLAGGDRLPAQGSTVTFLAEIVYFSAPYIAPVFGFGAAMFMFLSYIASDSGDLWKIITATFLGIFVALCGVIYRDMKDEMAQMRERQEKFQRSIDKMFGTILLLAVYSAEGDNKERLAESIKSMIESAR